MLHHITAIASNAHRLVSWYTEFLGLKLVKQTVNFDDPSSYHLYFGDSIGNPGTLLTFFVWPENARKSIRGTNSFSEIQLAVPRNSLRYWKERAEELHVIYNNPSERNGEQYMALLDPDGLKLELVETDIGHLNNPEGVIPEEYAVLGLVGAVLTSENHNIEVVKMLVALGYHADSNSSSTLRRVFVSQTDKIAHRITLVLAPGEKPSQLGLGATHHIAFLAESDEQQRYFKEKLNEIGIETTQRIDRQYFHSFYWNINGMTYEIATKNPGFTVDEPLDTLGTQIQLPPHLKVYRDTILQQLPKL